MPKKKISIIVCNLSSNSLVRTYPIAKTLSKRFEIEIIGILSGEKVYDPYKNEFRFKIIRKKKKGILGLVSSIFDVARSVDGDIIYVFKPKLMSFVPGLIAKLYKRKPLILDIEDLETANWINKSFSERLRLIFSRLDSNNEFINFLMEKLIPLANEKIVVSSYLQSQFGGSKVVHGVDTSTFDPTLYEKQKERYRLNLDQDKFYILFSGMPREHKGVEDLLDAIRNIADDRIRLLLVGGNKDDGYVAHLKKVGSFLLEHTGPQPHSLMPSYLSASDIVVLPQKDTLFASAQVPAKVFEAMAMKKPIIATKVSDLAEILENCGVLIEPIVNTHELEDKIQLLLEKKDYGNVLGTAAMKKSISCYSWDKMADDLYPIFDKYL